MQNIYITKQENHLRKSCCIRAMRFKYIPKSHQNRNVNYYVENKGFPCPLILLLENEI